MATSTWNSSDFNCGSETTFGNTWSTCSGTIVHGSAWSSTGAGTTLQTAGIRKYGGGFGVSNQIEGFNVGADEHTMDNATPGGTDLIALDFGSSKVALSAATVGYIGSGKDSDISVLAWTGANAPSSLSIALAGKALGSGATGLLGSGWTVVGNYANLALNTAKTINAGNISSSWWLISAYNSTWGTGTNLDGANDYIKILSIAGNVTQNLPEPSSLALAGVAVFGLLALRRKSKKLG